MKEKVVIFDKAATYRKGKSIYIMCESLRESHVGLLLCVENFAKDRPTMLSVLLMLVSDSVLPPPKQRAKQQLNSNYSANEYMITQLYPR